MYGDNTMKTKTILGALAAVTLLAGVAAAQPAEARCWSNGYEWHCWHPYHSGWHYHWYYHWWHR
jgi:hypothetical protein